MGVIQSSNCKRKVKKSLKSENNNRSVPAHLMSQKSVSEYFNSRQKTVIRETWRTWFAGTDTVIYGLDVFREIFAIRPDIRSLFPFRDVEDSQLDQHSLFRSHALRFIRAVESTISQLDALDIIAVPNLARVGEAHTMKHGFTPAYLAVFRTAMHRVWRRHLGRYIQFYRANLTIQLSACVFGW